MSSRGKILAGSLLFVLTLFLGVICSAGSCDEFFEKISGESSVDFSKNTIFEHPRLPGRKFIIRVQEDVVSGGLLRLVNDKSEKKFMAYVELLPIDDSGRPFLVSMATGIKAESKGQIELEWVSTLDYQLLLQRTKDVLSQLKPGASLFDAMQLNVIYGIKDETHHQLKFLSAYLKRVVFESDKISNEQIISYFSESDARSFKGGVGYAILEFLLRKIPVGTQLKFDVANRETKDGIIEGVIWDSTVLGRMTRRLGYEFIGLEKSEKSGLNEAKLEKIKEGREFFVWPQ